MKVSTFTLLNVRTYTKMMEFFNETIFSKYKPLFSRLVFKTSAQDSAELNLCTTVVLLEQCFVLIPYSGVFSSQLKQISYCNIINYNLFCTT